MFENSQVTVLDRSSKRLVFFFKKKKTRRLLRQVLSFFIYPHGFVFACIDVVLCRAKERGWSIYPEGGNGDTAFYFIAMLVQVLRKGKESVCQAWMGRTRV